MSLSGKGTKAGKGTKEDAAIIRAMMDSENRMLNDRNNWLVTIQGLFFAALGFAWDKADTKGLIAIVSLLGIAVALSAWTSFTLSNAARRELAELWTELKPDDYVGPDVIGKRSFNQETLARKVERSLRPWRALPFIFIIAWFFVLLFTLARA